MLCVVRYCFILNCPHVRSTDKTIDRVANESPLGERNERKNQPSSFSVYYLLCRVKRSVFTGGDFEYTEEHNARPDATTRSEPVPAWCRCNDGTHFFLCIGYFRFHDTSDRFDTKRARNVHAGCVRRAGRVRDSQNSRKFCSTAANEILREITSAVLRFCDKFFEDFASVIGSSFNPN